MGGLAAGDDGRGVPQVGRFLGGLQEGGCPAGPRGRRGLAEVCSLRSPGARRRGLQPQRPRLAVGRAPGALGPPRHRER
eukprot:4831640-Pyramimonas_sp.AAC.1